MALFNDEFINNYDSSYKEISIKHNKIIRFIGKVLDENQLDTVEKAFMAHNKKVWEMPHEEIAREKSCSKLVACRMTLLPSVILSNMLSELHHAEIKGYAIGVSNIKSRIILGKTKKIYESFNTDEFFVSSGCPGCSY